MLGLDHNAAYLLWALGITVVVLGAYGLYLRSRLLALRKRAPSQGSLGGGYSARNVSAATPSGPLNSACLRSVLITSPPRPQTLGMNESGDGCTA